MANLRPHRHFNFVGLWKKGFILSGILIVLSLVGLIASFAMTGSPVTLGTEFSGGTSIQITDTGDMTEDQVREAFDKAAQETGHDATISSLQTASSANTGNGFIIRTADTVSADITDIMVNVEQQLGVSEDNVQIETIGASWGAAVIWRSFLAFIISCLAILVVIAARYREPRMGVVALLTLFHDMLIVVGIYAWAGLFFHMEVTSDVIAALLAIIGYSLYDTIVSFHRINQNASRHEDVSQDLREHVRQPDLHALPEHLDHLDPAGAAHAHPGYGHPQGLRLCDVLRHGDRHLLHLRHLHAGLHHVEDPRPAVQAP